MQRGILDYTKDEIVDILKDNSIPKYRSDQIFIWIYRFGKTSFFDMTNLNKDLQNTLDQMFYIYRPVISKILKSSDGTLKFLLELKDGNKIETVFIPSSKRNTICVSSQVGCSVSCKFCNTGYNNGFTRNLTAEEIISQILVIKDHLTLWNNDDKRLTNVVFMGMGEPLFNISNVFMAVENLTSDEIEGLSKRKITISTSGISDVLEKIAKDIDCKLAISLHAPNDEIRSKIMPINNKYNIKSIIKGCKEYSKHHKYLKITFEYLLLKNINDSQECAHQLSDLLKNIRSKVNLLQFNQWYGCSFEPSSLETFQEFAKVLENNGIDVTVRIPRGVDIMAACGQLSSNNNL
jgi:23S rRNA (adenine2503-C2)-methyltransferase